MTSKASVREKVIQYTSQALGSFLSHAKPKICTKKEDEGVNIYFPQRSGPRSVDLMNAAIPAFAGKVKSVGSLSIRQFDEDHNQFRINCQTGEAMLETQRGSWWSVAIVQTQTAEQAQEAAGELQDQGIATVVLSDAEALITDERAKAAIKAITSHTFPSNEIKIPGIERKLKPAWDPKKLVIMFTPSGSEMNPNSCWTNSYTGPMNAPSVSSGDRELLQQ